VPGRGAAARVARRSGRAVAWVPGSTGREERKRQDDRAARQQAFQAAAAGKTRGGLRDRYISELRARGQEVPPGPDLDVELELLSGHPWRALWKMRRTIRLDQNR
jgi:hypothetical protein